MSLYHPVPFSTSSSGSSPRLYDAVVAADGSGDFLLPSTAFASGAKSVFVRQGTYVESADIDIPDGGVITGEAAGLVTIAFTGAFSLKIDNGGVFFSGGTISGTHVSTTITGLGTTFTSLSPGDYILINDVFYKVDTITNDTTLDLVDAYQGKSFGGEGFLGLPMQSGKIENLVITGSTTFGILLRGAVNTVVTNVLCTRNATGIQAFATGSTQILACVLQSNTVDGLQMVFDASLILTAVQIDNNANNGILVMTARSLIMDGVVITNNDVNGIDFSAGSSLQRAVLSDCTISFNGDGGVNLTSGVQCASFDGCRIESNGFDGIQIDGDCSIVSNCVIAFNEGNGITATAAQLIADGNHILQNTGDGLKADGANDHVITSNTIQSNGGDGINLDNSDDSIINSNRVLSNSSDGINVAATCTDTIITSNNAQGNTGTNINDLGAASVNANNKV